MDDSGSGNMINFNVSPVRKFVPLVPVPTEPAFISMECSPFDKSGSVSSSDDPFDLVLRSIAKAKSSSQCERVQEEKAGAQAPQPLKTTNLNHESEPSYVARVVPTGQSKSLLQALAIEGVGNFTCDEDITCIMDISDPTGGDSTSEFARSSVLADESSKLGDSLERLTASVGDKKQTMTSERDITSLVNEKLNSCIQMMLNGSYSKQQRDSSSSTRQLRRSLTDLRLASDVANVQGRQTPVVRRSLDVSLDSVLNISQKVSSHNSGGTGTSDSVPGSSGTASFLNRAFLRDASSEPTGMSTQSSGNSCDSDSSSAFAPGYSSAVTSVLVRRWLDSADGRMRALSCDTDFTPRATNNLPPSPAHSVVSLNNCSFSSVFSPPLVTEQDMQGRTVGESCSAVIDHSSQEAEPLSSEERLACEALKVAHNISNTAVADTYNETLDGIRVELYSSDEDDHEPSSNFQTHQHVTLFEPAVQPLPLDMGRVSSLSLHRSPTLPPPLLDHDRLVTRLKQLKASNQLPDKKLAPLRAIIPLGDMSKDAASNVCVLSSAQKTSQSLLSSLMSSDAGQLTSLNSKHKDTSTPGTGSQLKQRKGSTNSASTRSSSQSRSRQSSTSSVSSGLKLPSKSGLHQSPASSGSSRKSYLRESPHAVATSTPIRTETQDTGTNHTFPSVTPLTAGKQSDRRVSNFSKVSKENVVKKCSELSSNRRSRSLSVTPMKSVENQMLGTRASDRGGRKPLSVGKMVPHTVKFLRTARDKENIMPA